MEYVYTADNLMTCLTAQDPVQKGGCGTREYLLREFHRVSATDFQRQLMADKDGLTISLRLPTESTIVAEGQILVVGVAELVSSAQGKEG